MIFPIIIAFSSADLDCDETSWQTMAIAQSSAHHEYGLLECRALCLTQGRWQVQNCLLNWVWAVHGLNYAVRVDECTCYHTPKLLHQEEGISGSLTNDHWGEGWPYWNQNRDRGWPYQRCRNKGPVWNKLLRGPAAINAPRERGYEYWRNPYMHLASGKW